MDLRRLAPTLLLALGLEAGPAQPQVTLIPSGRCSSRIRPEVRLYSPVRGRCRVEVVRAGRAGPAATFTFPGPGTEVHGQLDLSGQSGVATVRCTFLDARGRRVAQRSQELEVVASASPSLRSTRLLDGCWISLYHWSEDEGRRFNPALGSLTAPEWREQILGLGRAGIRHVIVQNVFESDAYAGKHTMSPATYQGKAYYPSAAYGARHALGTPDPLEAILAAADEARLDVFLGVGLFAWFDFSPASLAWHKTITRELFQRYGQHPSLYGWYVSEELFGSLYHEWDFVKPSAYGEVRAFFKGYRAFVRRLTPTKPVALAPNNERFERYAKDWGEILPYVDILIPFGFARYEGPPNLEAVAGICRASHTHFWVDLELFAFPIVEGLAPKTCPDLVKEIRAYDALEQIYGYQFTGLMNPPESRKDLGGEPARRLYRDYLDYYHGVQAETRPAPDVKESK